MLELEGIDKLRGQLLEMLSGGNQNAATASTTPPAHGESGIDSATRGYLERIAVEMRGKVRVVPVAQIDYITASGPYAELHTSERGYVIRERMQALEERLDPARFLRIHRSIIVRLDTIDTLLRGGGGDYAVRLKNGVKLKVARTRVEELERRMGVGR